FSRPERATLPFCDRVVCVARKDVRPVWTQSFPISKEPQTLGEHLRKTRFTLGIRQSEAARKLGINARTLSLWECDKVFPTAPHHAAITAFLGYDPFMDDSKKPKGNEPLVVAFL